MAGKPSRRKRSMEREFEDLLLDVLEQDYDLPVRHGERRPRAATRDRRASTSSTTTTRPTRPRPWCGSTASRDFKAILPVDFASADGLRRSAEDCEALVLFLTEHLANVREKTLAEAASGRVRWGRREDD